ncbi:MAG: hypothetical protein MJ113_04470 [Lachnospiraceae bacterium]|nr:hypothetical protein [Lachnospiraceae bacterium]
MKKLAKLFSVASTLLVTGFGVYYLLRKFVLQDKDEENDIEDEFEEADVTATEKESESVAEAAENVAEAKDTAEEDREYVTIDVTEA